MKKLVFLFIASLLLISMAWSQPWSYDFGTGTGSHTTNSASTTFLPAPPSGTARVRVGTGAGSLNLENPGLAGLGSGSELRIVAPTGTSVNKFSVYDYTAGKTFFTKFDILLGSSTGGSATPGTFYFFQGDGAIYSDNNALTGAQVFSGIQWVYGSSGAVTTTYRNGSVWSALGTTPFAQGNVYTVEIYGNNTTASANYDRAGTSYSVASNKQDIWVNGTLIGDDLSKGQLANDANVDSFMFYGISSAGNVANCFLDNFTYSNSLPTGGVSAPTTQSSSISFSNVQQNQMDVSWTNGDGAKRVVIMNTTNTFTTPVDGTDPTANSVYGGSGQQVVYNNSGNTVTVTGLNASTAYWFRVYEYNGSGTGTKYLSSAATNNPNSQTTSAPAPVITLSTASLTGFTYVLGSGPSTEQTFTVSGTNLTQNISISAPTNYEISKTSGSGYTTPLTFTHSGGTVSEQTVYVRLKSGLSIGSYNNETITASSSGATDKTVTCSGSVTTPPAPNAPAATAATNTDETSFTANWNTVSSATGYRLDVYTKTAGTNATDLFISEYIEGGGNNKALEIFNGTGSAVDLSNYSLRKQANGAGAFGGNLALSGTLSNGEVYIVAHSSANSTILALADQTTGGTPLDFNGNDCVALYKSGVMIDVVGIIDQVSPNWGANVTLVRKEAATVPNTTYSASDWDSYASDTTTYLGSHTFSGGESIDYVIEDEDVSNVTTYGVTDLSPGTTYYYVVRAYNTSGTSANSNEIEVETTSPSATITTGAVSTPPFYVDSATSASGTVAYTSTGTFSGATFTAKLSDASGSFANPTSIGTASINGTDPSGNINISIPAGTAEGSGYKIRIDCGSPSITGSESSVFSIQNGAKNVTGVSSTVDSGSLTVSWTNPTTIYDEIMIVAKASASISGTPSGDGSSYTANLAYGSGTAFDSGHVVYKGATSPQTITNLTNQTTYYVKVFTRKNSNWSSGVEINNTPMAMPAIVDIIVPQFMQGLNGTNNQRIPTAFRFRLDNLTPSATYRYAGQMVLASSGETDTGGGNPWYVNSDNSFTRTFDPGLSSSGAYGEFTTDTNGSYTGWFMIEPTANNNFTPGSEVYWRVRLNNGSGGTAVATRLTSASAIKVINFGTQENVNQGTFLRGVSQSPAKNFIFVYDNEAGTGRPISGTVVESDGLDLSGVTQILPLYKNNVDAIPGAWGVIIPNSTGSKGFSGIKRIESRNLSDASIYGEATDSDGVWPSGTNTTNPTGGDTGSHLVMGEGDATLPVELSSFTVTMNAYNAAVLTWVTQTETGVNGFYIYRGTTDILSEAVLVSNLIPATNTSQTQVYRYSDSELFSEGTYYYWLNVNDMDGTETFHGPITLVYQTGDNPTPTIPKLTELKSIYPNPFNPSANISYGLATPAEVEFRIYNSRGQMVRNMALGMKDAGTWNLVWNGTDNSGQTVPTGVYYIRMQAGKDSFMRKAVMMK